ncbi:MAG: zinc-dependent alcohol dehydrogenase family protein [Actinomycetota bacterium]|nr:zinc-dependent alcohol dehydrogenase family protein [Actinomycetota bacterium]
MKAWALEKPGQISSRPLHLLEKPNPRPGAGEIRVRVSACGVCRTDLHLVEGDLPVRSRGVVPGHEIVGTVDEIGAGANRFAGGERVGIAWLRHTCGTCKWCAKGLENLCPSARFTGWDEDGGYAEYALVREDFAYTIPRSYDDIHAAPLLCAGIIGYRALQKAQVPPGGTLGLFGFGGSAHIAAQIALAQNIEVHVRTRSSAARALALELGAASADLPEAPPPVHLDSAILFAPVGDLVPVALEFLGPGGILAIAGIHLSAIPSLDYQRHLFNERELRSVTANTRSDAQDFLDIAAHIPLKISTVRFPFDEAPDALAALSSGMITGAAVIEL